MVKGEHLPRAAETGGDLVGDEKDAIAVAERAQFFQVQRRVYPHAGAALKKRLDDHRAALARVAGEGFLRGGEAFAAAAIALQAIFAAVAVGRLDAHGIHQHRPVYLCVEVHRSDGKGADRLPVVTVCEAEEARPFGMAALVLILEAHLERAFHRGRAVVREVEFRQPARHDPRKLLA